MCFFAGAQNLPKLFLQDVPAEERKSCIRHHGDRGRCKVDCWTCQWQLELDQVVEWNDSIKHMDSRCCSQGWICCMWPVVLIYEIDGISHLHKVTKQQVLLQVPVNGAFFHAIQIHVRTVNSHLPPWFTMLIFLSSRSCIHMFKPEFVGVIRLTFIRLTHRNSMNFHTAHLKSFKSSMSIPRKPSISHLGCFFPVEANCQFYGLAKLKKTLPLGFGCAPESIMNF